MITNILFFLSLGGIAFLFLLKIIELKRGLKPFSAFRYKADVILQKKVESAVAYTRYINWQTGKLLLNFLFSEMVSASAKLFKKIEESKVGAMVKGRHVVKGNGNGTNSEFLKGMSALKGEESKNSSN